MLTIESDTIESFHHWVTTTSDPTGAAPEYSVTGSARSDPGTWVDGAWSSGGWSAKTSRIGAFTATVGKAGADFEVESGGVYDLWCRWTTAGASQPVKRVGSFRVL